MNDNSPIVNLSDFILQTPIGEGAFGKVYLIKEKKTGKVYAAKTLLREIYGISNDSKLNFQREVKIISKLNHPSVLKFYGYSPVNFKNKPKPVIITDYAENKSLRYYLRSNPNEISESILNDTQKLIIIYGIASAVSYLHLHGIIHRDLKPDNVLLDSFLFPKICDFGLSKISIDIKKSQENIKGTPIYMAPEIWENNKYSNLSDVYAFAIIVYQIVTNEVPFPNYTFFQIRSEILKGKRPPFNSEIPESYKKLIQSCWSQNETSRPTFEDILIQLKTDKSFITEKVDEKKYYDYINYIENSQISFGHSKKIVFEDSFSKSIKSINYLLNKIRIAPFDYVKKLDDNCIRIVIEAENDPEKQYILAKCLIKGMNFFPINTQLAITYLKISMNNGYTKSAVYLCKIYIKGEIVNKNLKKVTKILETKLKNDQDNYLLLYGLVHLEEKNIDQAKICFETLIEKGNGKAMCEYGKMHENGIGFPINYNKAIEYYKKAIEKGIIKGIYLFGYLLVRFDKKELKDKGFNILKSAATKGHVKSMYTYSQLLLKRNEDDLKDDNSEAVLYLKKASEKGYLKAMEEYAERIMLISTTTNDEIEKYLKLLKICCDRGSDIAMICYGGILLKGDFGVSMNLKEAAKYMKILVNKGHKEAYSVYSNMLLHGIGVPIDKEKSLEYCKKAIELGDEDAMIHYATFLLREDDPTVDKKEAMKYLKIAADKGDENAIVAYASMLQKENSCEADLEQAAKYLKIAANNGCSNAMNAYALTLVKGIGIERNEEEAIKYYKMAIDNGFVISMNNLAQLLLLRNSNKNDVYQAKIYLQMAVDRGSVFAMRNYAYFLYNGIGMDVNRQEALNYLEMAINLGNIDAIPFYSFILIKHGDIESKIYGLKCLKTAFINNIPEAFFIYAHLCDNGIGIDVNKPLAFKYYGIAIEHGYNCYYHYAHMLEIGDGIEANLDEAIKYYKMGIDHKDKDSTERYAYLLENGIGMKADKEEADKYYKMASNFNDYGVSYGRSRGENAFELYFGQ